MNDIQVKSNNELLSIEVADMIGKGHKELLRDLRRYSTQLNESNIALVDFFTESTYKDSKGEIRPCYNITRKGCEFIANKLTGAKGTEFTAKYINKFHNMENKLIDMVPKTYKEALIQIVQQIEVNEELELENKEMKEKTEYYNAHIGRNLLTNFRDTAREFEIKEKALIDLLCKKKYIYRDLRGNLQPFAGTNKGYFKIKEFSSKYSSYTGTQTLITPKGRELIQKLINDALAADQNIKRICTR